MRLSIGAMVIGLALTAFAGEEGKPGAGIQSGTANGMAGGRTDVGPEGQTGIRRMKGAKHERARAKANSQARGPNKPGSFLRPADTAPQMNTHPKAIGSGAPEIPVDQEPPVRGKNLGRASHRGRAGGVASGKGNPGAASTKGSAGKGEQTKPAER
jgi:hypothetical protein